MLDPPLGILFLLLSAGLPPAHRHVQGSGSPAQAAQPDHLPKQVPSVNHTPCIHSFRGTHSNL